jgi:purine-nucleoside phosphorylase
MELSRRLTEAAQVVQSISPLRPQVALVLGSGLGFIEEILGKVSSLAYGDIPHFKASAVSGHAGRLLVGTLEGVPVMVLSGRIHFYEGHSLDEVCFAVRTAIRAGVRTVILTNAAGAIHPEWQPGEVMMISDQLNLQGANVLAGPHDPALGERFPDMSDLYDAELRERVRCGTVGGWLCLREGVYAGLLGPTYETPAEVRMLKALGADAVGMSTVQEAIAAHHMGARVLGFSVLTNLAAGVSPHPLSHAEVKETADAVRPHVLALLRHVVPLL